MNLLREFRKTSKKSIPTRIRLILVFSVVLITNTYAWWKTFDEIKMKNLEANVESWNVAYVINNLEELDEVSNFIVEEVYPGMPSYEDYVYIYNLGDNDTEIEFEIQSIKIFGQEVLEELKTNNEIKTEGNITKLFVNDTKYPFYISYTYDKNVLREKYEYGEIIDGKFVDEKNEEGLYGYETNDPAVATLTFNIDWEYEADQDELDTQMGKKAYEYYKDIENSEGNAIEIEIKITSSKINQN